MVDQIENLFRAIITLLAIALWVPVVVVWTIFAPLFAVLDVLGCIACRDGQEYESLEWTWAGVRMTANHRHKDAGGKVKP